MTDLREHYNLLADIRDSYINKNRYYHNLLSDYYRYFIPPQKKVLEIGCGTGELLHAVNPSVGVGIDLSEHMCQIAQKKFPDLKFYATDIAALKWEGTFDYILLSGTLGETNDIQQLLSDLRRFCHSDTRVIIEYYSYLWQIILKLAERLRLKIPQIVQNWMTRKDLENFLKLTGYEPIVLQRKILFPKYIPIVSFLLNKIIANLPVINALTLNHFLIARPVFPDKQEYSVSIIIPARNEKGNIEQAVTRTPMFGASQQFIFVEGHSKDNTFEEIKRVTQAHPDKAIQYYQQTGQGKGDAVRLGFEKATGDVLMILDADLTVPPEDLPKFYDALKEGTGEFINGSRLVYPMEKDAMRLLNLIANKFFGKFFSWLLGQPLKDTLCGTKVLMRHHYTAIAQNRHYFGDFDPFGDFDLIFGAAKQNLKIIEVPVHYKERVYGTTQIRRFVHGLLLFRMCWFAMRKIKFQ